MKKKEPSFVAETLKWCNERRAEKKLEPLDMLPKGKRRDGATCPCGAATGLFVNALSYGPDEHMAITGIPLPDPVCAFVHAFDEGQLPQYEVKP